MSAGVDGLPRGIVDTKPFLFSSVSGFPMKRCVLTCVSNELPNTCSSRDDWNDKPTCPYFRPLGRPS